MIYVNLLQNIAPFLFCFSYFNKNFLNKLYMINIHEFNIAYLFKYLWGFILFRIIKIYLLKLNPNQWIHFKYIKFTVWNA